MSAHPVVRSVFIKGKTDSLGYIEAAIRHADADIANGRWQFCIDTITITPAASKSSKNKQDPKSNKANRVFTVSTSLTSNHYHITQRGMKLLIKGDGIITMLNLKGGLALEPIIAIGGLRVKNWIDIGNYCSDIKLRLLNVHDPPYPPPDNSTTEDHFYDEIEEGTEIAAILLFQKISR